MRKVKRFEHKENYWGGGDKEGKVSVKETRSNEHKSYSEILNNTDDVHWKGKIYYQKGIEYKFCINSFFT